MTGELRAHERELGITLPSGSLPDPGDRASLQHAYLSLFEAMKQPFAPPVESPYKLWYGDRDGGLMDGPAATEMERRYETIDASPPPAYPADHIALLLEYGGLLLEAGAVEAYRSFLEEHLDWIGALAELVDAAAEDAVFYAFVIAVLDAVLAELRSQLEVTPPSAAEVEAMVERVDSNTLPQREDHVFDP